MRIISNTSIAPKNPSGTYLSEVVNALRLPLEQVREIITMEQVNDFVIESNEDPLHVRYHSTLQIDVENLVCPAETFYSISTNNASVLSTQVLYRLGGLGGLGMFVYYVLQSLF